VQALVQVQVSGKAFAQWALHVPASQPESEQLPVFAHERVHPSLHVETQLPVVPAAQSISQPPPSQEKTQFDCAPRHCIVHPPPGQSKTQLPVTVQSQGCPATQVMTTFP
jgi:hypothetical protein